MIKVEDLTIGYGKKIIQKNVNFQIHDGIFGLLGTSGIGKTTLLRTISGLTPQLSGNIFCDSEAFMMHQKYTNFAWLKCIDNILIVDEIQKRNPDLDRAMGMLKKVELLKYAKYYPTQLSGGMNQRLALARTLYANPKNLLMDEPLSALDENTRKKMQDLIMDYQEKTQSTILMVTHSKQEAQRMCKEIITL